MLDAKLLEDKVEQLTARADKADKAINVLVDALRIQEEINTNHSKRLISHLKIFDLLFQIIPKPVRDSDYDIRVRKEVQEFLKGMNL